MSEFVIPLGLSAAAPQLRRYIETQNVAGAALLGGRGVTRHGKSSCAWLPLRLAWRPCTAGSWAVTRGQHYEQGCLVLLLTVWWHRDFVLDEEIVCLAIGSSENPHLATRMG